MAQPLELLGKKCRPFSTPRPTPPVFSTAAPQILEANQARSSQTNLGSSSDIEDWMDHPSTKRSNECRYTLRIESSAWFHMVSMYFLDHYNSYMNRLQNPLLKGIGYSV